ncbi:MAG TPA: hypothetical protein VGF33_10215, partial [Caulobacteraceae bacterium]
MANPNTDPSVRRGRRIGVFLFDGVMALDAVGPADVFGLANILRLREDPAAREEYDVRFVGLRKGSIRT